jgi:hypothetical protein
MIAAVSGARLIRGIVVTAAVLMVAGCTTTRPAPVIDRMPQTFEETTAAVAARKD